MPKVIHLRGKCIGCAVCAEMQPELWCMSKKDGKATLLHASSKRDIFVLVVDDLILDRTLVIAKACPVNIIKIS
ncbi:ferredoxin [Desertivirga arenae]|uniref:ferredoxin n=1 Tax=Desertivirga arenae TaxID=2810309 RepID=UPI001A975850|nr:ferredoxin [Pedobacter sp. SYSU D00823]